MLKAVIFDYNGVVKKINKYFFDDVELIFSLSAEEKENAKKMTRDLFEQLDKGLLKEDIFWLKFSQRINKPMPVNVKELSRKLFNEHFELYEEVVNMLKDLKTNGYITAVLSDTFPYMAEITRERNGYDYFDKVYLSCEVGFVKPQKEFYELAVKDLAVPPSDCIFIDDSEGNLLPAKEMGMKTVLAKNPDQIVEDAWII
ncbi:MAG: HAD family phosphatase, partial [Candidatus Staskawiczbacteria bacterium]|nr:HAD family phosphatase [Candidatus Staskawiczbacteria bacterium]